MKQKPLYLRRSLAALMAVLLSMGLLAGCGGNETPNTSDVSTEASASDDVTPSDTTTSGSEADGSTTAGSETEGSGTTTAKNDGKTSTTTTKKTDPTKAPTGKNVWGSDPYANIPANLKGSTVKLLMWRDLWTEEKKVIEEFTKKTGIQVKHESTKTTANYSQTLINKISSNDAPDVVALQSADFPNFPASTLQSLDSEIFRLDDPCWDKSMMDPLKINGKYFGVAMENTWNCYDTMFVAYYKPSVLKACGVTEDPATLYKQGKWTWDKFAEMARKVHAKGSTYLGADFQYMDILMLTTGNDFVNYDGKAFKSGANVESLIKAWEITADLFTKKDIGADWKLSDFNSNRVGFMFAISYGMRKEAGWFSGNLNQISTVPIPTQNGKNGYIPVKMKTWGTARGAKNVEGAAYFLRYFLDANNVDMSSTFMHKNAENTFKEMCAYDKKMPSYAEGVMASLGTQEYQKLLWTLAQTSPANITTALNQQAGTIKKAADASNKKLVKAK